MTRTALAFGQTLASLDETDDLSERVRTLVKAELAPLVDAIDQGKVYPVDVLRNLGGIGAWAAHLPADGAADLRPAIGAMAAIGECCGATSFMAWCQNTLAWYVGNTENSALKARLLDRVACGAMLGGTGLSSRGGGSRAATWSAAPCRGSPISRRTTCSARSSSSRTDPAKR